MTETSTDNITFASLGLLPEVMQGIEDAGFSVCTPIQAETLPPALKGHDVAGQAQTGTGKTAAFLVAVFQHLLTRPAAAERRPQQVRTLILAPTRELALQIHKDAVTLGKHTGLRFAVVYGGTGYTEQAAELEAGVDVLIGTPGRTIDYFKQHLFDLRHAQAVVLDEADRMFDLGFIKDVRYLLRRCPKPDERLGLLFSATLSWRVTELAYEHMNDPRVIRIEPEQVTAEKVTQTLYHTANKEKIPLLIGMLKQMDAHRTIVFVNTKHQTERVWSYLEGNGIKAAILSGDVPQKKRMRLLGEFQKGDLPVMVATDVAARGLHIPDVSHVFNFDLPQDAEDYVHRIGRTARAGAAGDAISFACENYVYSLPEIEDYIGYKLQAEPVPEALIGEIQPPVRIERRKRDAGRGGKGPPGRGGHGGERKGGPRSRGGGRRGSRANRES